eukprot:CAMPEP_0115003984 /NCGR_PEP_ID=MMETSP0216-20121206/18936_1 /TAXON_ID=223996 /ORGANISM="Protocruzia adherens, Strain Boccale" /LENGTH=270 /DNA_ID=CAMNT_0002369893 /DNA_START=107 /DNA_END=919 /DNA_ORIENTATION=+
MGNSSSTSKIAGITLGAGLVLGGLVYFLLSDDSQEERKSNETTAKPSEEKKPVPASNFTNSDSYNGAPNNSAAAGGQLDKSELLRIIDLITDKGATAIADLKNDGREERKECVDNWEKYKLLCVQHLQKQEMLVEELTREILSNNGIDENKFYYMMQAHMSNPEVMTAIQKMNSPTTSVPVDITVEKMKDIFTFHLSKMEEMKNQQLGFQDFFLYAIKISDEIYFKFNIETEQIRPCISFLNMEKDADYINYQNKLKALSAGQMQMGQQF